MTIQCHVSIRHSSLKSVKFRLLVLPFIRESSSSCLEDYGCSTDERNYETIDKLLIDKLTRLVSVVRTFLGYALPIPDYMY